MPDHYCNIFLFCSDRNLSDIELLKKTQSLIQARQATITTEAESGKHRHCMSIPIPTWTIATPGGGGVDAFYEIASDEGAHWIRDCPSGGGAFLRNVILDGMPGY